MLFNKPQVIGKKFLQPFDAVKVLVPDEIRTEDSVRNFIDV